MESYRGFYEYPSSQAAIHVVPAKTVGSISPGKAKRNWGNILRLPGWSKKDREVSSSSQATIYAPAFNLPQAYHYTNPKYPNQNNHFISSTPYREPGKYYVQDNKEKYGNYNCTYGRSSGSNLTPVHSSRSSKNTVRYTDWFGSVVGRKAPVRPSLPVFHTPPTPLSPENGGVPTLSSWDSYVNMQSPPPHAVEIPALVPVQNYGNICMCPDQLFSTRSKKKKKCKQCGKKYGTVKHATAIGSVAKIRPAIPPNFYKAPVNTHWGWSQGPKVVYTHPAHPALQNHPNPMILREDEDDDDSAPPTPETVRTVRSGNSGRSNGSNNTITPDSFRSPKSIPPPPTVPLPSIPKSTTTPPPSSSKIDKRNTLFRSVPTAYDLIDHKKDTSSDELSDNAVDTSWENLNEPISVTNKRNSSNSSSRTDQNRVSVISIGSDGPPRNVSNDIEIITSSKGDTNKVTIFNPSRTVNENKKGNSTASLVKLNGYHEPNSAKYGVYNEEISPYQNGIPSFLDHSTKSENNSVLHPNKTSSQNKRTKYNVREREIDYNSLLKLDEPGRDSTKVVTIAGQRILLDQKQTKRSSRPNNKFKYYENDRRKDTISKDVQKADISDWDTLDEFENMNYKNIESTANYTSNSKSQKSLYSHKSHTPEEENSKVNTFSPKQVDYKWSKLPPSIKDTIHEEEEEESFNEVEHNGHLFKHEEEVKEEEKEVEELEIERESKCEKDENNQIPDATDNSEEPQAVELQTDYKRDHSLANGYHQQEVENEGSCSSADSPVRTNGFQPTLSELLQVKSILKRPNSLDTSSETDSDFYLPTFSEYKQNVRKKKSVQFQQSDEINLMRGDQDPKGENANALRTSRKERGRRKEKDAKVDIISDLQDIYARNNLQKVKVNSHKSKLSNNYDNNWNSIEGSNLGQPIEESANNTNDVTQSSGDLSENSKCDQINKQSEGTGNIRRTLSHRQTGDVTVPAFNDTYRLRQTSSRPSVSFPEDASPLEVRRPTRKAPPPPRNSATNPLRPTVPPPPPPPSQPPTSTSSDSLFKEENTLTEETCDNEVASSLSSTSLSPPPSPPPPLPSSSPPPLPSSSPPPLDEESDDIVSSPEVPFSSFIDPNSNVSISARSQQIQLKSTNSLPLQDSALPTSPSSSSVFKNDFNESPNLATIKGRIKATKNPHNRQNSDVPQVNGSELTGTGKGNSNTKRPARSRNPNSSQRMFFLSSMVEETDTEERFSDHIYEEVPSFPSSPSGGLPNFQEKSIFDGASKYEILEFLQDARNRVDIGVDDAEDLNLVNALTSDLQNLGMEDEEEQTGGENQEDGLLPSRYTDGRSSNRSSNSESSENSGLLRSDKERLAAGEIERTDSGVGSETSKTLDNSRRNTRGSASSIASGCHVGLRDGDLPPCDDCDSPVEARVTNSGVMFAPLVCRRCARRRQERKEILTEIIETEVKYGRDLKVMMDQFCRPMSVAGLLSPAQLDKIFLNVDELIEHNRHFSLQLRDAYEIALDQGDEDLLTVNVAKLFLQASLMLHAFQNYCVRQGAASILLQNLEKEKELLRIFLRVSQMENTLLRRMNLHSFLMVPVQRVTKYPLLLGRLYKTTPPSHSSREDCRRAREKIELYLQHINNETKELSPTKLWRRISMSVGNNTPNKWVTQPPEYDTSMKLRSVALDVLDWGNEDAYVIREGRLLCLPPESTNWTRRGRGLKMATVQMVLVTLGRPKFTLEEKVPEDGLVTPCDLGIKEAAILAFKDHRLTKTALIRDPWLLSKTVITWDAEGEAECFELTDLSTKETFIFKDRESVGTEEWFRSTQFHALSVGSWRRRRHALANIMINGASRTS